MGRVLPEGAVSLDPRRVLANSTSGIGYNTVLMSWY